MHTLLKKLLGDDRPLQIKRTAFLEVLSQKKEDKNRLKAYYELIILAQSCLDTAAEIDFTDFLEDSRNEIKAIQAQAANLLIENQEHYKWSEQVRKSLFAESVEHDMLSSLGEEIRTKLDEMDRIIAQQNERTKSQAFSTLSDAVNE